MRKCSNRGIGTVNREHNMSEKGLTKKVEG